MRTPVCDDLGIEFPIFAFTHCRDVVAAVSNAGGLGVLGAVGFSAEQLETELQWIDDHVGDNPYGVDIVIPQKYEGQDLTDPEELRQRLLSMVPDEHRNFTRALLDEKGMPPLTEEEKSDGLLGWTAATAAPQIEVIKQHPKVNLLANALGTPPQDIIDDMHATGRKVAALCGSAKQALSHTSAGVDIIIAQGTEGGGHTGDVGSMVLWPEVIDAVGDTPVLAAGGIGNGRQMAAAMAMGAQGAWTGSLWLTVDEAAASEAQRATYHAAGSRDTVRSRSFTGKPARMLRNEWTEAWEHPDNPKPLGMPLQMLVANECMRRSAKAGDAGQVVGFNPCGQIIGQIDHSRSSRDVVIGMVEEFVEATERLHSLTTAAV